MDREILYAFIRTLVALPLVVALAYFVIKYGLARRAMIYRGPGGRRMQVVEQIPLGAKAILSIVQVGDKYYLLAHSETGIELIKEYDTLPQGLEVEGAAGTLLDFRDILRLKFKDTGRGQNDRTEGENGREK